MRLGRRRRMQPFATRGRRVIAAILATIALISALSVGLSIRETSRSQHQAALVEVAARQRTLAERYLNDVLLARSGFRSDPGYTASLLHQSAAALIGGGTAPAVNGDDDETVLTPPSDETAIDQLQQAQRLGFDLTRSGAAFLRTGSLAGVRLTAGETASAGGDVQRLRALTALTSNVSLNAARTIAAQTDRNVNGLLKTQAVAGASGLLISLLLGMALIAVTRRQTAHFRSLVRSSTDLVLAFGGSDCLYASPSVGDLLGGSEAALGRGFLKLVHPKDREIAEQSILTCEPAEPVLRVMNRFGEWRHLEAHITDLRADRDVRAVVFNARDVTERVNLEDELTRQAFHDSLTGLANRALFRDRLEQALARPGAAERTVSVLLIDLDGFKQVNDSLGHDAGDILLEQAGRRFSGIMRAGDTLARLGGDEFAILLDGAGEDRALEVGTALIETLAEPFSLADQKVAINASVGIVVAGAAGAEAEDLIRDADIAMYSAKESGSGRCEVFHREMAREFGELLGLEHELRTALREKQISVHYQPEVSLDGTVVGVEALIRWNSPTRGQVPPLRFIPLAERNGMIFELGSFVLERACLQTASWMEAGLLGEDFVTWVNVSGRQLSAGGLAAEVIAILERSGLPSRRLGLEVTETSLVEGPGGERAKAELEEIHERGVRIAIDDFGTGFSALGQLRHFPIDMLKVDRSFVAGIEDDPKDAAITENLINLAHTLGVVAIAEGIESQGQLDVVRSLGCDLAQGYLFGKPTEPEQLTELLARGAAAPGARSGAAS